MMVIQKAVETTIDAIIDVVHVTGFFTLHLTDGMYLGNQGESRSDIKTARLCNYLHTTTHGKEPIQCIVNHSSNLLTEDDTKSYKVLFSKALKQLLCFDITYKYFRNRCASISRKSTTNVQKIEVISKLLCSIVKKQPC